MSVLARTPTTELLGHLCPSLLYWLKQQQNKELQHLLLIYLVKRRRQDRSKFLLLQIGS